VEYTRGRNPKPPADAIVRSWVLDSLRMVNHSNVRNSISSAGLHNDFMQWHIAKHDVYGNDFIQAWKRSGDVEICPEEGHPTR
jgi:hypothetical protein